MTTEQKKADINYEGWAPCVHTDEGKQKALEWAKPLLEELDPENRKDCWWSGGPLEVVMWLLNQWDVEFHCYSDMWVGVVSEGKIGDVNAPDAKTAHVFIQADTFLLALLETYRWWRDEGGKKDT